MTRGTSSIGGSRLAGLRRAGGAVLLVAGLHGAAGLARADVPTPLHVAACNEAARDTVRSRDVSANAKDEVDAAAARKSGEARPEPSGPPAAATQSADPQIHGMDGEGAKDAAYRAAYRVCMRRNGF